MSGPRVATAVLRAAGRRAPASTVSTPTLRAVPISTTSRAAVQTSTRRALASNKHKNEPAHAGSFARTDDSITVEYPEEHELPASEPIAGAAQRPTLGKFSLQGKVGVVTGGARGLGLVMGQGMVVSGADLAIVDMNSSFSPHSEGRRDLRLAWTGEMLTRMAVQRRKPRSRPRPSSTSSGPRFLMSRSGFPSANSEALRSYPTPPPFTQRQVSPYAQAVLAPVPLVRLFHSLCS